MNENLTTNLERWISETKTEMQLEKAFKMPSLRGASNNGNATLTQKVTATGSKAEEERLRSKSLDGFLGGLPDGSSLDDDNQEQLLQVFKNNPSSGCTSLMDMARVAAGFDPTEPFNDDNLVKFRNYLKRVANCPLMTINYADTVSYDKKVSDWNDAIKGMVDLFEGIETSQKNKIKDSLINLTKCALSHTKTEQSTTLFTQSTINVDNSGLYFYAYYSSVKIVADKKKGHTVVQNKFNISRIKLRFYTEYWPSYAEKVMNAHVKSFDNWLNDNNTPDGDNMPDLFCFAGK